LGVASTSNVPGARESSTSWTDANGNLWLFGGYVLSSAAYFNDLWEFSPTTKTWTWASGSSSVNASGVYGTQGVAASTNVPGARYGAANWTDGSGNFWLFGGYGTFFYAAGNQSLTTYFNDLWEFNPSAKTWTWVSGASGGNSTLPVYGTQGVAAATNIPGGRYGAVSWIDGSGNLWLFGGYGTFSTGGNGSLNDLWEFNFANKTWTWVSGASTNGQMGVYGTQGIAASTNVPGARYGAANWTDGSGNLWLFGGYGNGSLNQVVGYLNDLWEFNPIAKTWTWVSGSNSINASGVYGTLGVAASTNVPGGRNGAVSWTDGSGNFWLFGGGSYLNDLWEFNTTGKTWTWVNGSNSINSSGVYGTLGVAAATNVPGGRSNAVRWMDTSGNLWIFGGLGFDSTGTAGDINNLWRYQP
jgi:hypothetical protein